MSDDDTSTLPEKRSWLERLSHAFSGEPQSREDLIEILRDARENGILSGDTLKMLEGALSVSEHQVSDIMVPRSQMVSLPISAAFIDLMKMVVESGHSRFPVHGDDKDDILGILLAKDLLRGIVADGGPGSIRELLRPAVLRLRRDLPKQQRIDGRRTHFRRKCRECTRLRIERGQTAGLLMQRRECGHPCVVG